MRDGAPSGPLTRELVRGKIGVTMLCGYLLVVALRLGSCYQPDARVRDALAAAGPQIGEAFPAFELRDVQGTRIRNADLAGRAAVVLFVPSLDWSPPTKARILDLARLVGGRRDLVVALILPETQATPRSLRFVREHDTPFYVLVDSQGLTERLGLGSDAPDGTRTTLPATFVLDPEGKVLLREVRRDPRLWLAPEAILAAMAPARGG